MTNEVETILREIRERVRAEEEERVRANPIVEGGLSENASPANNESLNGLSAHLTTTSRAWDRLPPLVSNRRGTAARVELWVKARMKSLTRWFTLEQINFNSAVHHALLDTQHALHSYSQELARLRSELEKERADRDDQTSALLKQTADLRSFRASLEAQYAAMQSRLMALQEEINAQVDQKLDTQLKTHLNARISELTAELRAEQAVCFKQLSLATGEAAVMEDRGRRAIQSRLDEIEKRIENRKPASGKP